MTAKNPDEHCLDRPRWVSAKFFKIECFDSIALCTRLTFSNRFHCTDFGRAWFLLPACSCSWWLWGTIIPTIDNLSLLQKLVRSALFLENMFLNISCCALLCFSRVGYVISWLFRHCFIRVHSRRWGRVISVLKLPWITVSLDQQGWRTRAYLTDVFALLMPIAVRDYAFYRRNLASSLPCFSTNVSSTPASITNTRTQIRFAIPKDQFPLI